MITAKEEKLLLELVSDVTLAVESAKGVNVGLMIEEALHRAYEMGKVANHETLYR